MIASCRDVMPRLPTAWYISGVPKYAVHTQLSFVFQEYLQSAPSILAKGSWNDGSGGREYPAGLVIDDSPTQEPSPTVQRFPLGLGEPIAVLQVPPPRGSSAATTSAALCSSRAALGSVLPGKSRVISSKVAPSSLMHSPVCQANGTTASMLVGSWSNAVVPIVCIPGPCPRSWSLTLCLSLSACETFDATAIVISVIPPLHSHLVIAVSQLSPVDVTILFVESS